jgi:hypothetical protein
MTILQMQVHLKVVVIILLLNTDNNYLTFFADNSDSDKERGLQIDKRIIFTTPEVFHATDHLSNL